MEKLDNLNATWNGAPANIPEMLDRARQAMEKLKRLPKPDFESIVFTREAFEERFSEHVNIKVPEDATGFESLLYGIPVRFFNTNVEALLSASGEAIRASKRVLLVTIECGEITAKVFNGEAINGFRNTCMEPVLCPRPSLNHYRPLFG